MRHPFHSNGSFSETCMCETNCFFSLSIISPPLNPLHHPSISPPSSVLSPHLSSFSYLLLTLYLYLFLSLHLSSSASPLYSTFPQSSTSSRHHSQLSIISIPLLNPLLNPFITLSTTPQSSIEYLPSISPSQHHLSTNLFFSA